MLDRTVINLLSISVVHRAAPVFIATFFPGVSYAADHNLPAFTPTPIEPPPPYKPNEDEAHGYYYGLPSCPLLVARSS